MKNGMPKSVILLTIVVAAMAAVADASLSASVIVNREELATMSDGQVLGIGK